jgi:hypothetical protein
MRIFHRNFDLGPKDGQRRQRASDNPLLERVGKDLKAAYAPVIHEPLPGEISSLLRRLDERDIR